MDYSSGRYILYLFLRGQPDPLSSPYSLTALSLQPTIYPAVIYFVSVLKSALPSLYIFPLYLDTESYPLRLYFLWEAPSASIISCTCYIANHISLQLPVDPSTL